LLYIEHASIVQSPLMSIEGGDKPRDIRKDLEAVPNPSKEKVVGLNQWFPLIDPKNDRGIIEPLLGEDKFVDTETSLKVDFYEKPLPVTLLLTHGWLGWDIRKDVEYEEDDFPSYDRSSTIVPFNLKEGYTISDEDSDAETRLAKRKRLSGVIPETIDDEDQYVVEEIGLWLRDPKETDSSTPDTDYDLPNDFERLNVALSFPTMRIQTDYGDWQNPDAWHRVGFKTTEGFYNPGAPHVRLSLVVPGSEEKLSQVQAKFFLTEKRANELKDLFQSDSDRKVGEDSEED
jgi:hypothetical protein